LFYEAIPFEFIARVFEVTVQAEQHTFQVLTKREDRLVELAPELPWPSNVWMGVSIENRRFVHRADRLRQARQQAGRAVARSPVRGRGGEDPRLHRPRRGTRRGRHRLRRPRGEESPSLTFAARAHARRPLYTSAAGKTLLANVPDDEMYRLLDLAAPEHAGAVGQFLADLPEIRSRGLAFNRGTTIPGAFVVATPLLAPDGGLIAAISAAVEEPEADRLDDLGEELKQAVATLGPKYWPQTRINGARRRR
jgi:Protein of unknown function (DUF5131)/Bacterial transcriptional regulator